MAARSSRCRAGCVICPGSHRHARAPARARAGAQGNGGDRHARRRSPAASPPSRACRTPIPVNDNAGVTELILRKAAEAQSRARLSDRRRVARAEGRAARRHRRAARRRLRGGDRRRASGGDGAAGAPRARVHEHVRHADDRALRGSVAQGRRLRARRSARGGARACKGIPGRRRIDHGGARRPARGDDRRSRAHRAHERVDDARSGAAGQEPRRQGDLRGGAASLHADRRCARRAGAVRHQHQDEPAAARGARSRRHARGHRRRQRRRRSPPITRRTTTTRRTSSSTARRSASSGSRRPSRLRSTGWCTPG